MQSISPGLHAPAFISTFVGSRCYILTQRVYLSVHILYIWPSIDIYCEKLMTKKTGSRPSYQAVIMRFVSKQIGSVSDTTNHVETSILNWAEIEYSYSILSLCSVTWFSDKNKLRGSRDPYRISSSSCTLELRYGHRGLVCTCIDNVMTLTFYILSCWILNRRFEGSKILVIL